MVFQTKHSTLTRGVVLALLLLTAAPASGQVSFELLELPGNGRWADFSLSDDGQQMGCLLDGAVYWWAASHGFRFLDAGSPTLAGVGMSAGGNAMIAARKTPAGTVPTIWYRDGSSVELGLVPDKCRVESHADSGYDLSGDGSIAVGQGTSCDAAVGFIWSRAVGLHTVPLVVGADSRATAVSGSGQTVVGFCEHPTSGYRRPVVWQDESAPQFFLGEATAGEAHNVSLDGRYVVGQAEMGGLSPQAFFWSVGQEPISLGNLSGRGTDASQATSVANDGKVVGWSGDEFSESQEAFIWTAQTGTQALADVAVAGGVTLPTGLRLTRALDISGDGSTVVGVCRDKYWNQLYWRMHLGAEALVATTNRKPHPMPPPLVMPDSVDIHQADMMNPFPFGKRRN
ncbi:MAG: hypothetical protein ACI9UK_000377 [Candidatus Krumholzibacteriia bacterium]|jgi:hypothetical protein